MLVEPKAYAYNPKFLADARAKQKQREAAMKAEAIRKARIAMLLEEAEKARTEILAIKAARDAEMRARIDAGLLYRSPVDRVLIRASLVFGLPQRVIRTKSRRPDMVFARQFTMYWLRRRTKLSLPQIARLMGCADHTTVYYALSAYPMKRAKQGRTLRRAR